MMLVKNAHAYTFGLGKKLEVAGNAKLLSEL